MLFGAKVVYGVIVGVVLAVLLCIFFGATRENPVVFDGKHPRKPDEDDDDQGEENFPFGEVTFAGRTDRSDRHFSVYEVSPEWSYDEDGAEISFISSPDQDDEEIELKKEEVAVFLDASPDEDCEAESRYAIVVTDQEGKLIFREVVRDDEMPDVSENCVTAWNEKGHPISIYCGVGLGVSAICCR